MQPFLLIITEDTFVMLPLPRGLSVLLPECFSHSQMSFAYILVGCHRLEIAQCLSH
jgi:hypothetical protein